jgi:hypothetical protein
MKKFFAFVFFLFTLEAFADQCNIKISDLKEVVQSVNKTGALVIPNLTDPDSGEPARRYVQAFPDGSVILLEQKRCYMHNLTVTLLLPDAVSKSVAPQRLGRMLSEIPVWNKWSKCFSNFIFRNFMPLWRNYEWMSN